MWQVIGVRNRRGPLVTLFEHSAKKAAQFRLRQSLGLHLHVKGIIGLSMWATVVWYCIKTRVETRSRIDITVYYTESQLERLIEWFITLFVVAVAFHRILDRIDNTNTSRHQSQVREHRAHRPALFSPPAEWIRLKHDVTWLLSVH